MTKIVSKLSYTYYAGPITAWVVANIAGSCAFWPETSKASETWWPLILFLLSSTVLIFGLGYFLRVLFSPKLIIFDEEIYFRKNRLKPLEIIPLDTIVDFTWGQLVLFLIHGLIKRQWKQIVSSLLYILLEGGNLILLIINLIILVKYVLSFIHIVLRIISFNCVHWKIENLEGGERNLGRLSLSNIFSSSILKIFFKQFVFSVQEFFSNLKNT